MAIPSVPTITFPTAGSTVTGTITVQWSASSFSGGLVSEFTWTDATGGAPTANFTWSDS